MNRGKKTRAPLRAIPAVERVLQALPDTGLPRPVVVDRVRRELAALRRGGPIPDLAEIVGHIRGQLETLRRQRIQPVINGTGVLVHTNLGRSPLAAGAVANLTAVAAHYNNLEFDLATGERGGRAGYLEHNLALLCQAEAAAVANNCAAALVVILRHFTRKKPEVVISRGELIQIGGGFRIPEILEASGAKLREVGTTNRTDLGDYTRAITRETALVLKVHRSNFFMGGFVAAPATEEIAAVCQKKSVPLVEDLGSGAIIDTAQFPGLEHEPTPAEALQRGVDLVCFSGDKLLGGPQAGIIAGKQKYVAALKREPFFRALRCDKLVLAALEATVDLYLAGEVDAIPVLAMLRQSLAALEERAQDLIARLAGAPLRCAVAEVKSQLGGGTLPRSSIPSVALRLAPHDGSTAELGRRLAAGRPPVIGYVARNHFHLDLRTVFPDQDETLLQCLLAAV